jgi:FtsP/CotA-like multicopper oxidase with cupredoxin domain
MIIMGRRLILLGIIALATGLHPESSIADGPGNLRAAIDLNPDPDILEVELIAAQRRVDLSGNGLFANAYTINGAVTGPELRLKVGDLVIVHFTNELSEPTSVHWHGIEVDNANDGTNVTQNPVPTGEQFTYKFRVQRPGVFMYHSHFLPTNPEFKGFYGPIYVRDAAERTMVSRGVLPDLDQTHTLVLADTTVCKAPGKNDTVTFPANPNLPWSMSRKGLGDFPGHTAYPAPKDLCENPRDNLGNPQDTGPLAAGEIPNIQPALDCGAKTSCRVNEGQLVLTNGRVPAVRTGSPEQPGKLADGAETIPVEAGAGLRLRLLNPSVSRYFRLRMTNQNGQQVTIYRIGGEGGLLDRVRVEGGSLGKLDTKYDRGEILVTPGDRADVVVTVPPGKAGDVITLWTQDYQQYGTTVYPYGYGAVPTVPVAHFEIVGATGKDDHYQIAAGDPLRTHPAVEDPVETLKTIPITAHLLDPGKFAEPLPGSAKETILFTVVGLRESVDGIHGMPLVGLGVEDYRDIPHIASSRYANLGDLLELTLENGTQMHHPLHHHGFSFQPVRLIDRDDEVIYEYEYNEFIDTIDIPAMHKLVYRMRLDDRPKVETGEPGGAAGRWFFHCHILNHAELGMMSELVVLEP